MSTESCCLPQPRVQGNCPACGHPGKPVASATTDQWVLPEYRARLKGGPALICITPDCPTIYYTASGETISKSQVIARVGLKHGPGVSPVCYCFGHTREAIESEVRVTGRSRVPELITAEVKAGRCECETRNPEGRCCLGRVNEAVKNAQARSSQEAKLEEKASAPVICDDSGCAL